VGEDAHRHVRVVVQGLVEALGELFAELGEGWRQS
jgi:hypothetical protein